MSRAPGADLDRGLKRLHLPTIRRLYRDLAEQAEKGEWTYNEYLEQLVAEEIAHRAETRIQRAIRKAKFPYVKTIEQFDFTFQASIKRKALGRYLGPELVEEGRCVVLKGKTGRGKTHLAIAFAYKAIQNGYEARFTTVAALLNDLHRARAGSCLQQAQKAYVDVPVLVLDEMGYLTYGPDAANFLFPVIDQRYLRREPGRSTLITTNKDPEEWAKVLNDHDLSDAIVDRLLERGEVLQLRGKSYRNPGREKGGEAA